MCLMVDLICAESLVFFWRFIKFGALPFCLTTLRCALYVREHTRWIRLSVNLFNIILIVIHVLDYVSRSVPLIFHLPWFFFASDFNTNFMNRNRFVQETPWSSSLVLNAAILRHDRLSKFYCYTNLQINCLLML